MYLFLVRAFNDIDHITPIVWKMRQDNYPVALFCWEPTYDLQSDARLLFLRKQGVKVNYIFDEFDRSLGLSHRVTRFVIRNCFAVANKSDSHSGGLFSAASPMIKKVARILGKALHKSTRAKFYDISWAYGIIEQTGTKALCFDHVNPKRYIANVLFLAANQKSVPTIALPHGVYLYTNDFVRIGSAEGSRYDKFNRFDHIITQNELRREVLSRAGVDREKIFVLGSTRYCNEWMTQYKKILPHTMKIDAGSSDKLKAVFMTTRFAYRIDKERMVRTFDLLAETGGFETVVKPHTRSGKEAQVYDNMPLANAGEYSSVELCQWADVVMVIGSSILIEPLKQGKPVLYLKYLHENTTQYEELGACWIIHDETELKDALQSLRDDITKVPYTEENVTRFLSEIIYGGQNARDVLGDYEDFIVTHARE